MVNWLTHAFTDENEVQLHCPACNTINFHGASSEITDCIQTSEWFTKLKGSTRGHVEVHLYRCEGTCFTGKREEPSRFWALVLNELKGCVYLNWVPVKLELTAFQTPAE